MERKIGEIFEFKKDWYQCVEGRCKDCHFSEKRFLCKQFITKDFCTHGIIFKKLKKVGEPYMDGGKIMQKYKRVYREPIYFPYKELNCYNDLHGRICIEIKQNKEDMEEKYSELTDIVHEYMDKDMTYKDFKEAINDWVDDYIANKESNKPTLKPFDIQKAREGKPVCTRDGRKARIICFDTKGDMPIIALITINESGQEYPATYDNEGRFSKDESTKDLDLMMLSEKRSGWAKIRKDVNLYDTKEEADRKMIGNDEYVTAKVCWEE